MPISHGGAGQVAKIHSRFSNYQVLLAAFLLVLAALSAEEGIVFSLLVCLIELVSALRWRRRPSFSALLMAGVALAYVPLYLWFFCVQHGGILAGKLPARA